MIQKTLGDVRAEVARVCGTSGMPITSALVVQRINYAIQELMNEGAWPGVVDRWHIRVTDGLIALPPELDTLLEFTVDGVPQQIMSPWAEFVNYGPGVQEDILPRGGYGAAGYGRSWWGCSGGNVYDRGESPVRTEIPVSDGSCGCSETPVGPWKIRQYATREEEADIYATVQGLDEEGLVIRTQVETSDGSGMEWINGERIPISDGSSYWESTNNFSKITAYTKPQTNGYVRLVASNGTDEIELSNYAPWETTPSYHRYWSPRLNSLTCQGTDDSCLGVIFARCRRRFVPVAEDTDILIIGNVLAIKEMVIAQWKREANALAEYAAHKQTAIDLMKKESIAYTGKVRTPAISFQRGTSIGYLPVVR